MEAEKEAGSSETSEQVAALLRQRRSELVRSLDLWLRHDQELVQRLFQSVDQDQAFGFQTIENNHHRPELIEAVASGTSLDNSDEEVGKGTSGSSTLVQGAERGGRCGMWVNRGSMRSDKEGDGQSSEEPCEHRNADAGERRMSLMADNLEYMAALRRVPCKSLEDVGDPALTPQRALSSSRQKIQAFVHSAAFAGCVFCVILTNIVLVGVETDYSAGGIVDDPSSGKYAFNIAHVVYTCLFSLELGLRVVAEGRRFFYATGCSWNWFETLIVVLSVVDSFLSNVQGHEDLTTFSSNWVIRLFRVVRILRTLRIVRVVSFIREVCVVVQSITATLKSLVWAMVLMLIVLYGFGIAFTQAVTDYRNHDYPTEQGEVPTLEQFWGTLPRSILSLFKAVTGGISWGEVLTPLGQVAWFLVVLFLVFFIFTFFALLNVMTAVFCQNAIESASADKELASLQLMANRKQWTQEMRALFSSIDANQSGEIDVQEFELSLQDERMRAFLASREIDVHDAWTLFKLLDSDQQGVIEIDNFVEGLLQLKGPAKAMQIAKVLQDCKLVRQRLDTLSSLVDERFEQLLETRRRSEPLFSPRGLEDMQPKNRLGRSAWYGRCGDDDEPDPGPVDAEALPTLCTGTPYCASRCFPGAREPAAPPPTAPSSELGHEVSEGSRCWAGGAAGHGGERES